jgi:hypothetical protein
MLGSTAPRRKARPPKPDNALPNADISPPRAPPTASAYAAPRPTAAALPFDDRPLMAAGITGFGISIPYLTGLFGPIGWDDWRHWAGSAWFMALAAAIWLGNRWLLLEQREHFDWFANPWRKLGMLVTANVLFTAPITLAALAAWFVAAGLPIDATALKVVTLTNVICVVFVTHAYETVFLIRERESDLIRVERLERMRAVAELGALKAQIDPHFLFNSLNTLGHLIAHDTRRGREFCDTLAEVYRYVLASRQQDLVPLRSELDFTRQYHRLLVLRFGDAITLELDAGLLEPGTGDQWLIPPLALQTLLENAVKHNQLGDDAPLALRMGLANGAVQVANDARPRSSARPSSGLGLANLDERCRLLTGSGLDVQRGPGPFVVRVPMLSAHHARAGTIRSTPTPVTAP